MNRTINLQSAAPGPAPAGRRALRRLAEAIGRFVCLSAFMAAMGFLAATPEAAAQDAVALDYQVKAAYLLNFPKYMDWPAGVLAETNSPITVAIFGDADVANEFGKMIEGGKSIDGHPIVLKRITDEADITNDCQILYVAASERPRLQAILEKVKGSSVLTVGETDDFLAKGGIINLVHRDRKIRLQVDLAAAEDARLKISSRLLVVAEVLKSKPQ